MPKDLPKEINDAIDLLWKYSTDACLSSGTKEELDADGYECKGESAHFITFVIERNDVKAEKRE